MKPNTNTPPITVKFTRGSIVESYSRAYVTVVDSSGNLIYNLGDPDFVTFMRSSAKPIQALTVLLTGAAEKFNLTESEISIICGSHGGEPFHLETIISILGKAGLTKEFLKCGTQQPLDEQARKNLRIEGGKPERIHHNCSGKHSGMLITAKHMKESLDDYLDVNGVTQNRISSILADLAGIPVSEIIHGVDGCGAPVHALTMRSSAYAFARLLEPEGMKSETARAAQRITRAMRAYPEMIAANQGRICTELMRVGRVFELTAKGGAEGFYSAAWRDQETGRGFGMSVKIEDGSQRARDPLVVSLLQKFNILPKDLGQCLQPFLPGIITNFCGDEVGRIKMRI